MNRRTQQGGHKEQNQITKSPPKVANVVAAGRFMMRNCYQTFGRLSGESDFSSPNSVVYQTAQNGKEIRKKRKLDHIRSQNSQITQSTSTNQWILFNNK